MNRRGFFKLLPSLSIGGFISGRRFIHEALDTDEAHEVVLSDEAREEIWQTVEVDPLTTVSGSNFTFGIPPRLASNKFDRCVWHHVSDH